MNALRDLLHKLARTKAFRPFATVFETLDGIVFGPTEVTVGAPHVVDNIEIKRYMSFAIIALLPSTVAAIVFFGFRVLAIIIASYVAGGVVEVTFAIIRKRHIEEGFLVTGLIFPLVLPPTTPIWVVVVGIAFGVFFGKEVFGGTGRNIFNPALVGRLFITIAFPEIMSSSWQAPFTDAITAATPLASFKSAGEIAPYLDLLIGNVAGSTGETSVLLILLGGALLLAFGIIKWHIPVFYVATVFLLSWAMGQDPIFHILAGGLMLGAFFMATDYVTGPLTTQGRIIFAVAAGVLVVLIRVLGNMPEGVNYSILIMNAFTPLIDRYVRQRPFGLVKSKGRG